MSIRRANTKRQVTSVANGRIFVGCASQQRERLDQLATVVTVPAGRVLAEQGSVGREFGVILDGEAIVEVDGIEVARLSNGDHYGELALLDEPGSRCLRRATVITTRRTTLAAMTASEFRTMLDDVPVAGMRIMRVALERSRPLTP